MKNPIVVLVFVATLFAANVSATELPTGGNENQRAATKSALKREIVEHLSGAIVNPDNQIAYVDIILAVNADGSVVLEDWSKSHPELEGFLLKQIALMKLEAEEISTAEKFGFRVRFDLL